MLGAEEARVQRILLITTLARYQTAFWIRVARALREKGQESAFLAFDDPSDAMLRSAGLRSFNAFNLGAQASGTTAAIERELAATLGWTLPLTISHERITYGVRDSEALGRKLARHRTAAAQALEQLHSEGCAPTVVQELGGFLSVVATFLAARACGLDNLFIEPAFFKGRFFATRNTFAAPRVGAADPDDPVDADAVARMDSARDTRSIVIPTKDRHHYTAAFAKIANVPNARRLVEKLYEKYVRGERHEFGHIGSYVGKHVRMAVNSLQLRNAYRAVEQGARFVYYPLHVPADVALTLRAPEYLDQVSLIDYLARIVPSTHRVVIKEHPAQIGALGARPLSELLRRHDNVVLLRPTINNYDVLAACDLVVSVNSKSGAEALLLGKPVVVLGDAFYADSGLVRRVDGPAQLAGAVRDGLTAPEIPKREEVERFFSRVWRASHEGELYVAEPRPAERFAASLQEALESG